MRELEEIKKNPKLRNVKSYPDGVHGDVRMGGWDGSVICSWGAGWEHVSVSPYLKRIMPSWQDMCQLKNIFWKDDEAVIQVHPAKEDYVDNMPNCLHLWRCTYKEMVLPPSCFVGIKKGQTQAELLKEIKKAYEMAGEKFE